MCLASKLAYVRKHFQGFCLIKETEIYKKSSHSSLFSLCCTEPYKVNGIETLFGTFAEKQLWRLQAKYSSYAPLPDPGKRVIIIPSSCYLTYFNMAYGWFPRNKQVGMPRDLPHKTPSSGTNYKHNFLDHLVTEDQFLKQFDFSKIFKQINAQLVKPPKGEQYLSI